MDDQGLVEAPARGRPWVAVVIVVAVLAVAVAAWAWTRHRDDERDQRAARGIAAAIAADEAGGYCPADGATLDDEAVNGCALDDGTIFRGFVVHTCDTGSRLAVGDIGWGYLGRPFHADQELPDGERVACGLP